VSIFTQWPYEIRVFFTHGGQEQAEALPIGTLFNVGGVAYNIVGFDKGKMILHKDRKCPNCNGTGHV
jgi:hypothetical protein